MVDEIVDELTEEQLALFADVLTAWKALQEVSLRAPGEPHNSLLKLVSVTEALANSVTEYSVVDSVKKAYENSGKSFQVAVNDPLLDFDGPGSLLSELCLAVYQLLDAESSAAFRDASDSYEFFIECVKDNYIP